MFYGSHEVGDYFDTTGALCAQTDPDLFFPEIGGSGQQARAICAECPVQLACLEYAIRHRVQGIWAGTMEKERRAMAQAAGIQQVTIRPWIPFLDGDRGAVAA